MASAAGADGSAKVSLPAAFSRTEELLEHHRVCRQQLRVLAETVVEKFVAQTEQT